MLQEKIRQMETAQEAEKKRQMEAEEAERCRRQAMQNRAFARALKQIEEDKKEVIELRNCELQDLHAKVLANVLNNSFVKNLWLGNNHLGDVGVQSLAEALKENTTLQNL